MDDMHLIVGLGNPGAEYARTRHNAGFLAVQKLADRWAVQWTSEKKFSARVARAECAGRRVVLCEPHTFMNASGDSVGPLVQFYRVELSRVLVVVDDADLPFGEIRLRARGSSGGHHGLESIERRLGSRDFARLRVGIGRRDAVRNIANYVLGRFAPDEWPVAERVLGAAADQVECWVQNGIEKAMNQFNGVVTTP